jgi:C4-dicarboxylate transporter, DctM subunit
MIDALLGFAAVFALALLRVPLAFAMGFVGFVGLGLLRGWAPTAANAAQVVYDSGFAYTLSVVPLFVLMGNFVARAGLAHELFRVAYAFIGHVRGGLAHATVIACAGFGAICGSSIATAATMSQGGLSADEEAGLCRPPERRRHRRRRHAGHHDPAVDHPGDLRHRHRDRHRQAVRRRRAAGAAVRRPADGPVVAFITWRDPDPPARRASAHLGRALAALRDMWGVVLLFVVVLGGIYGGVFTATEGAGIGASGAFFFALARRALTLKRAASRCWWRARAPRPCCSPS